MADIPDEFRIGSPTSSDPPQNSYSTSSSDDDDEFAETVKVLFNRIYKDPLQDTMDVLDSQALKVVRTGKITVAGKAGGRRFLHLKLLV